MGWQAEKRNSELQKLGVGVKIVCVGKKATAYFKRRLDRFEVAGAAQCPGPSALDPGDQKQFSEHCKSGWLDLPWRSCRCFVVRCFWVPVRSAQSCVLLFVAASRAAGSAAAGDALSAGAHARAANFTLTATPSTKEAQAIADELYAGFVSEVRRRARPAPAAS